MMTPSIRLLAPIVLAEVHCVVDEDRAQRFRQVFSRADERLPAIVRGLPMGLTRHYRCCQHAPKGYIYFAMGFSVFVESINLRIRSKRNAVHLRRHLPNE
jgi:hypothetical protein